MPLPGFETEKFLVAGAERLTPYLETGVVFRLWRTRMPRGPQEDTAHTAEDDLRIRHFGGLASQASAVMRVMCPVFLGPVTAVLVFGPVCPYLEALELVQEEGEHTEIEKEPMPPLLVRLEWEAHIPSGKLDPVSRHQICYRRLCTPPPGADEVECARCEAASQWNEVDAFEQVVTRENPNVVHEIPVVGPQFILGAEYMVKVRMGTRSRWGNWSAECPFSLAMHPPKPPPSAEVEVKPVVLDDGAIFFRIKWPVFRPHPLCTLVEYRVRLMRVTHYKYAIRLSDEMRQRSEVSLNAQQKLHVVGHVRRRIPWRQIPLSTCLTDAQDPVEEEEGEEYLEFLYDIAADPECGYRFIIDAKHERCSETVANGGEAWSEAVWSDEVITPPQDKNWFVPAQVPLDIAPSLAVSHRQRARPPFPLNVPVSVAERFSLNDSHRPFVLVYAPWLTCSEAKEWPHRLSSPPTYLVRTRRGIRFLATKTSSRLSGICQGAWNTSRRRLIPVRKLDKNWLGSR
jgi:hypothetical protein